MNKKVIMEDVNNHLNLNWSQFGKTTLDSNKIRITGVLTNGTTDFKVNLIISEGFANQSEERIKETVLARLSGLLNPIKLALRSPK